MPPPPPPAPPAPDDSPSSGLLHLLHSILLRRRSLMRDIIIPHISTTNMIIASFLLARQHIIASYLPQIFDRHSRLRPRLVDLDTIQRPQFARFLDDNDTAAAHFHTHFRLTHASFARLCTLIPERVIKPNNQQRALSHREEVLVWLAFLTREHEEAGVSALFNVSPSTVHKCVVNVTARLLSPDNIRTYIKMPSRERQAAIAAAIDQKHQIPHCVGFIDGTLVRLDLEPQAAGRKLGSHKWFNAINVVAICDQDGYFWSVDVTKPGSMHDSKVWLSSYLSEKWDHFDWIHGALLVGDSAYTLAPNMITPFRVDQCDEAKLSAVELDRRLLFNACHRSARNAIERAFGRLKNRFRLLKGMPLDPKYGHSYDVITCCFMLHNMLQEWGDDVDMQLDRNVLKRTIKDVVLTNKNAMPELHELHASVAHEPPAHHADGKAARESIVEHVDTFYPQQECAGHTSRADLIARERRQLEGKASKRKQKAAAIAAKVAAALAAMEVAQNEAVQNPGAAAPGAQAAALGAQAAALGAQAAAPNAEGAAPGAQAAAPNAQAAAPNAHAADGASPNARAAVAAAQDQPAPKRRRLQPA